MSRELDEQLKTAKQAVFARKLFNYSYISIMLIAFVYGLFCYDLAEIEHGRLYFEKTGISLTLPHGWEPDTQREGCLVVLFPEGENPPRLPAILVRVLYLPEEIEESTFYHGQMKRAIGHINYVGSTFEEIEINGMACVHFTAADHVGDPYPRAEGWFIKDEERTIAVIGRAESGEFEELRPLFEDVACSLRVER